MPVMQRIHGHEVMRMMIDCEKRFSRESLVAEIHKHYGKDARFYTCSDQDMNAEELVTFLEGRNKFIYFREGDFVTHPSKICQHGELG